MADDDRDDWDNRDDRDNWDDWDERNNNLEKKIQKDKAKDRRQIMRAFGLFTQLGLSMVFCILFGFILGRFLDGLIGIFPVLTVIFSFIGSGAALKVMYDIVKDWE